MTKYVTIAELKAKIVREVSWYFATFRKPMRHRDLFNNVKALFNKSKANDLFEVCLQMRLENTLVILSNKKAQKFFLPIHHNEIKKLVGNVDTDEYTEYT